MVHNDIGMCIYRGHMGEVVVLIEKLRMNDYGFILAHNNSSLLPLIM
mgnify:CR=1 FL=1|jgi:hypothetical protein